MSPDDFLAGLSVERRQEAWMEMVENSGESGVLVPEDMGTVVGFSRYSPSRDEVADPSTGEITSILRSGGFDTTTLWVLDGNVTARAFYEGWHHDGGVKVGARGSLELRELRYQTVL